MSDLPEGWVKATLADVAQVNPRHPRGIADDLPVTFTPMPALSEENPSFQFAQEKTFAAGRKGFTHFAEGDVLFAKITPCMENGKGAVASGLANGLGFGTTELHVLRPHDGVSPYFLYHFLHQKAFRKSAEAAFTGSAGQARVPVAFIKAAPIPLAPPDEQRRIVAKLDALLTRVNACRQRLDKIPKLLARFRQSVLAAACSGRLTADWRDGSLTEDLPSGWRLIPLEELVTSLDYGTSSKSESDGDVPVLRMGNIQAGQLNWDNLVYSSNKREIEQYSLSPGTVLFNRTNSPELVGKTAIYRGERPAIFAGYLIRINTKPELNPEYLNLCLNSPEAKQFCRSVKTDGVSQSNINARKLATFEVPFCPEKEQQEIVRRVDQLFAFADRLEARVETARKRVDALTQSILAKAFRGELVPTEAELARAENRTYETAAQLLERIAGLNPKSTDKPKRKLRNQKSTAS